jgi:hypothetical protein
MIIVTYPRIGRMLPYVLSLSLPPTPPHPTHPRITQNYTDWSQSNTAQRFRQMSDAIQSLPTQMFFEICDQGSAMVWTWGATIGQSWRMTDDIQSNWDSIMGIVEFNTMHLDTVGFFAHNDMDMMVGFLFFSLFFSFLFELDWIDG